MYAAAIYASFENMKGEKMVTGRSRATTMFVLKVK
jgi:hypothetical protein